MTLRSYQYADPATHIKFERELCTGCTHERTRYKQGEFWQVCSKQNKHGSRCGLFTLKKD